MNSVYRDFAEALIKQKLGPYTNYSYIILCSTLPILVLRLLPLKIDLTSVVGFRAFDLDRGQVRV
jgi:hypothetical protein